MKRRVFAAVATVGLVILCLAISHKGEAGIPSQELVRMPSAFKTAVEGIDIVGINVVYQRDNSPALDVTIRNNTARNVTMILLESITPNHSSGYGLGSARENPLLPAFGTTTMKFDASGLLEDAPLTVAAVIWDDGSTSGLPQKAERMKKAITDAAEQAAIKEKAGHQ